MTEPITVLIADSQGTFRTGLVAILGREPDITVIGEASNGDEALEKAINLKPQILLMDATLCDISTVIPKIQENAPSVMTMILGDAPQEGEVFRNLYYGVKGYLLKSSPHTEIAQAIRKVATGEVMLSPSVATSMVKELQNGKTKPKLSEREMEVLELLGDGLTNREIAERLFVSEGTIKTYVSRLREKLNLNNRRELSLYAAKWPLTSRITNRLQELKLQTNPDDRGEATSTMTPSPELNETTAHKINETEDQPANVIEGERKTATALCLGLDWQSDVKEQLNAEKIHELMGEILDLMIQQIQHYDGTVSWFNENGFIALFGIPVTQEHTPQKAISAAISILDNIDHYFSQLRNSSINVSIRIGINTGTILMKGGNSDSPERRRRYIPVGDTTSCAIKARDLAPANTILVTEDTYNVTKNQFVFLPIDELTTNSSREPLKTYSVLGHNQDNNKTLISPTRRLTQFVGRERELETLRRAFDEAKQGAVQLVGVVGNAGIGKSRLLMQFREELASATFTYVEGSCLHYSDVIPYLPLLQCLRNYFDTTTGGDEAVTRKKVEGKVRSFDNKDLNILAPLQDILSLNVTDEEYLKLEPTKKKDRIFEAVKNLILMESQSKPILIVLEDCHWTDKPSEMLLDYLLDTLINARVMFIMLYRPEWNHQFGNRSNYTQVRLNELSQDMCLELTSSILKDGEADPILHKLVLDRTGGNPLFIEEILHDLRDSGFLHKNAKQYTLTVKPSEIKAPSSLQTIIAARIDRLESRSKQLLQLASVIGQDFSYRIIEKLVGVDQEIKPSLLNLQRNEFIYAAGLAAEPHYIFKHALIQDVAYQSLSTKSRKQLHEKIGLAIESLYSQRLEEFYEILAHHYSQSDNYENAYKYLKLSAKKALIKTSSLSASFQYCKEAIDVLHKSPQTEENKRKGIEIRLDIMSSMQGLAHPEGSFQILHEGEMLCKEMHDDKSLAQVYSVMSFGYAVRGNGDERVLYAQKAFDIADRVGDVDLMAPIGFDLSSIYNIGGESAKTVAVASRVIRLLENTHRESELFGRGHIPYTSILASYGRATATLGDINKGKILCDKALHFAEDVAHDPFDIGWAHLMLSWIYVAKGDGQNLVHHAQKAVEYLEAAHMPFLAGVAYSALGIGYYFLENLDLSQKNAERAIEISKNTGVSFYISLAHILLGMIKFQSGDSENARVCMEQGLKLAQDNGEKWIKGLAMIWLGRCMVHADASQQEDAEKSILYGIQIFDELQSRPYAAIGHLLLGEFLAETCHKPKALQHLKKAEASFTEMGMDYWLQRAQALLEKLS